MVVQKPGSRWDSWWWHDDSPAVFRLEGQLVVDESLCINPDLVNGVGFTASWRSGFSGKGSLLDGAVLKSITMLSFVRDRVCSYNQKTRLHVQRGVEAGTGWLIFALQFTARMMDATENMDLAHAGFPFVFIHVFEKVSKRDSLKHGDWSICELHDKPASSRTLVEHSNILGEVSSSFRTPIHRIQCMGRNPLRRQVWSDLRTRSRACLHGVSVKKLWSLWANLNFCICENVVL